MSETPMASKRPRLFCRLARIAERGLAFVGLLVIVYWFCFDYSRVASESMEPTLMGRDFQHGDQVLTERISYKVHPPRRWDVITMRSNEFGQVMKRVVGLPGETIQMNHDGQIRIDGQIVEPPEHLQSICYLPLGNLFGNRKVSCGNGFFVLGDYSRDSDDSRFNGPVAPDQIVGRAWIIVGPSGRRGFVNR